MPALLALIPYFAAPPRRLQSSSQICCWMQFDFLCSWGTSPAYDCRVIPAALCTPLCCTCSCLSGDDMSSSHMWASCRTCSRCNPIYSWAQICCRGQHSCMFRLSTTPLRPWYPSWPSRFPPCSPLQEKLLMMRCFLCSASSTWWRWGSPATVLGWRLLCLYSPLQLRLASSAGLPCHFPCIAQQVLHGSLDFPKTHFLWHQWLLRPQS